MKALILTIILLSLCVSSYGVNNYEATFGSLQTQFIWYRHTDAPIELRCVSEIDVIASNHFIAIGSDCYQYNLPRYQQEQGNKRRKISGPLIPTIDDIIGSITPKNQALITAIEFHKISGNPSNDRVYYSGVSLSATTYRKNVSKGLARPAMPFVLRSKVKGKRMTESAHLSFHVAASTAGPWQGNTILAGTFPMAALANYVNIPGLTIPIIEDVGLFATAEEIVRYREGYNTTSSLAVDASEDPPQNNVGTPADPYNLVQLNAMLALNLGPDPRRQYLGREGLGPEDFKRYGEEITVYNVMGIKDQEVLRNLSKTDFRTHLNYYQRYKLYRLWHRWWNFRGG